MATKAKRQGLNLRCVGVGCGRQITFFGADVDDILSQIDASGWHDRPDPYGDLCPNCDEIENAQEE